MKVYRIYNLGTCIDIFLLIYLMIKGLLIHVITLKVLNYYHLVREKINSNSNDIFKMLKRRTEWIFLYYY